MPHLWTANLRRNHLMRQALARVEELSRLYHAAYLMLRDHNMTQDDTAAVKYLVLTRRALGRRMDEASAFVAVADGRLAARYGHVCDSVDRLDEQIDELRRDRNELTLLEYEANGMDGDVIDSIRETLNDTGMFLGRIDSITVNTGEEGDD